MIGQLRERTEVEEPEGVQAEVDAAMPSQQDLVEQPMAMILEPEVGGAAERMHVVVEAEGDEDVFGFGSGFDEA